MSITCAICLLTYSENEHVVAIDCGHMYHYDCLNRSIFNNSRCPSCRQNFNMQSITKLYLNIVDSEDSEDTQSHSSRETRTERRLRRILGQQKIVLSNLSDQISEISLNMEQKDLQIEHLQRTLIPRLEIPCVLKPIFDGSDMYTVEIEYERLNSFPIIPVVFYSKMPPYNNYWQNGQN